MKPTTANVRKSSVLKAAANKTAPKTPLPLPQSLEAFDKVLHVLACSKCGTIPTERTFTLGNCFHKYCQDCASATAGKPCLVCNKTAKAGLMQEDIFSISLIAALMKLKEALNQETATEDQEEEEKKEVEQSPSTSSSSKGPNKENLKKGKGKSKKKVVEEEDEDEEGTRELFSPSPSKKAKKEEEEEEPPASETPKKEKEAEESKRSAPPKPIRQYKGKANKVSAVVSTPVPTPKRASASAEILETPKSASSASDSKPGSSNGKNGKGKNPNPPDTPKSIPSNPGSPAGSLLNTSFSSTTSTGKIDKKNAKGETQLHIACKAGNVPKARQLLEVGADPNVQDNAGWTPLHEAINGKGSPSCKLELVKLLFEHACNPNIPGMGNETALHEAARGELKEVVLCLLGHEASPNLRNKDGQLPRDVAATDDIAKLFEGEKAVTTPDSSLVDDPVVLDIQMSKALLYFHYDVSKSDLAFVEKKLDLKVSKILKGDVTHIVFPSDLVNQEKKVPLSFQYLYGVAAGMWMLSSEWVEKSISAQRVLSPTAFEIHGCLEGKDETNAVRCGRLNKEHGGPGLFHGFCFYFYKNTSFGSFPKKDLISLAKLANADIINREPNPNLVDPLEYPVRFHLKNDNHKLVLTSHIILYDEKNKPPAPKLYNMEHMKALNVRWLIDSLEDFMIKDPEHYV